MPLKNSSKNERVSLLQQQVYIAAITLAAVVVVILLSRPVYREMREAATEQFNQQQLILARSTATGIEAYYQELSAALSSLAKLPSVQRMTPECLQEMQHTYWGFPPRTSLRLLDSDGVLRFTYPFEDWRGELIGRDYSGETYFQEAQETGHISVSGAIVNEQGGTQTRIRIAVPVYLTHETETVRVGDETGIIVTPIDPDKDPDEPESGRFQGVLVGSLDPHTITQGFISPIVSGKTGYAWLLNDEGIFLAHHEEGFTGRSGFEVRTERNPDVSYEAIEQIQRRMMAGEEGVGRYVSGWHRGESGEIEKLVAYTPVHINDNTWSVAVCAPVSEVEEIIQTTRRAEQYTLSFVILVLMIGGLCLFTTSYHWSRSLEQEVARRTRELRETSDYLTNLIRHANAPIIVWNPDRQVTIFNEAFEKMSGRTEAEMMEQPLDVLFPEESRPDALHKIESAARGEYWETVEIPVLRQDGEIRIGLWNSANIYGEDGKTLLATVAQGQDITEHKRAEEAQRESEEKYRALFETAKDAIFLTDEAGRFVDINRAACESLGYSKEELLKLSNREIDADLRGYEAFMKVRDGLAKEITFEVNQRRKDGTLLPVEVSGSFFTSGNQRMSLAIARDITERKRAEEALRESMEQYHTTLDSMADAIHVVGPDLRIILFNTTLKEWCKEVGLATDVTGKTIFEAFPFLPDGVCDEFRRVFETGRISITEEINKISGQEIITETRKIPIFEKGQVARAITVTRDITERKQAEEALRRSLEMTSRGQRLLLALSQAAQSVQRARTPDEVYQTVADEVARLGYSAAIFTLTDDRARLTVSHLTFGPSVMRAVEKLTGIPAQDYRHLLSPGGFFERVIAAGETTFVEQTTEAIAEALPGPLRPLANRLATTLGLERAICAPLIVGCETHGLMVVVGSDLTEADVPTVTAFATQAATAVENAWLFEEIRAGHEQLRSLASYLQTAREEERTRIAREIHDEFGQALTALKMDLAWLTKRLVTDSPRLAEKTGTMSSLIDSTIQTVRRVATELRPGLLDDLGLAAAIEWQAQELAERTGINCELYLGDEDILLDRDLATAIFRIFQETLTNVARHAEATEVRVELEDSPDELVLTIRDNGKGIASAQVSDPHSLGLVGIRERARSWGGDVTFQSAPGQGTIVTVRMPRPDESV